MNKKHLHVLLSFIAVIAFSQAMAQTHPNIGIDRYATTHQQVSQQHSASTLSLNSAFSPPKTHSPVSHKQPWNHPDAAASGYLYEGFEGAIFPPAGWFTTSLFGDSWFQTFINGEGGHTGNFLAYDSYTFSYESDWLVTPGFTVAAGDSAKLWFSDAFVGSPPDSFEVLISTTGQDPTTNTFTRLDLLYDGNGYPNPYLQWIQLKYDLTPYAGQTVYIAFRHANNFGDGVVIDDVQLGKAPADEVGTQSVNLPPSAGVGSPTVLSATVFNLGGSIHKFDVTIKGSDGFTSTKSVNGLAPFGSRTINFDPWTPSATGSYTFSAYTTLAGDTTTFDDTAIGSAPVLVLNTFKNYGWVEKAGGNINGFDAGLATWKYQFCTGCSPEINEYGGAPAYAFNIRQAQQVYDPVTDTWTYSIKEPVGLAWAVPQTVKNNCYIIGGSNSYPNASSLTLIWDNVGQAWSLGKSIPIAAQDYASGLYNDSLIYIVMGTTDGFEGLNDVQIYNPAKNRWTVGTPTPGDGLLGCRGAITGNKIIVAGGYDPLTGLTSNQVLVGDIDPADPTQISWESKSSLPGGTNFRFAAGVNFVNDSLVYFTGGTPDALVASIGLQGTYAYNPYTDQWFVGPNKITGINNLENMVPIMLNDTMYLAVYGGYDGIRGSNKLELLNIGPAISVPTGVHNAPEAVNHLSAVPNPFTTSALIGLNLDAAQDVTIQVNDVLGRSIVVLFKGKLQSGQHTFTWDASKFAKGIYFCHAQFENTGETLKLIKQ